MASGSPAYLEDDTEVLVSKATWTLKLSGLLFAGLLLLGRSASYGNVTWTPVYHPPATPLIVVQTPGPPAPKPNQVRTLDPAALNKKSAADEVVVFNSGDGEGHGEGNGQHSTGDHVSGTGDHSTSHSESVKSGAPTSHPTQATHSVQRAHVTKTTETSHANGGSHVSHSGDDGADPGKGDVTRVDNFSKHHDGGDDGDSDAAGSGVTAGGSGHDSANTAGTANESSGSVAQTGESGAGTGHETSGSVAQTGESGAGTGNETSGSVAQTGVSAAPTAVETTASVGGTLVETTESVGLMGAETSGEIGAVSTVTETSGEVGGGVSGTAVETTNEVQRVTTTTGGVTTTASAGAQTPTLANTGGGPLQQPGRLPLGADGFAAGLLVALGAIWLKRRDLFGRWMR
jgi:hypothetical protein